MSDTRRMEIDCDLTASTVAHAAGLLGVTPEQVTVACSHLNSACAQKIKDEYRCNVVLLPSEMLYGGADTWCVMHEHRSVWSPGG